MGIVVPPRKWTSLSGEVILILPFWVEGFGLCCGVGLFAGLGLFVGLGGFAGVGEFEAGGVADARIIPPAGIAAELGMQPERHSTFNVSTATGSSASPLNPRSSTLLIPLNK